jgi:transcription initiation factor TFIIIB Brf1 subunit/transcription initiation factor TFIIB
MASCNWCGSHKFVFDYGAGDKTCTECGTVAEERMMMDDYFYNVTWCKDSHCLPAQSFENVPPTSHHKNKHLFTDSSPSKAVMQLDMMLAHLHMDNTIIAESAHALHKAVKERYSFRCNMLTASLACCIYLACMQTKTERISRGACEIYDKFKIDCKAFYRALKEIQDVVPKDASVADHRFSEKDGIIRQLERLESVPLERIHEVALRVAFYNSIRKDMRYMMATPPTTINAVLILLACEDLGIRVEKKKITQMKWASIVTLKKHIKHIRDHFKQRQT